MGESQNRTTIGTRVYMPKKPAGYSSPRHPRGDRFGIVDSHNHLFSDTVNVKWDATKRKEESTDMELWKWLVPEKTELKNRIKASKVACVEARNTGKQTKRKENGKS